MRCDDLGDVIGSSILMNTCPPTFRGGEKIRLPVDLPRRVTVSLRKAKVLKVASVGTHNRLHIPDMPFILEIKDAKLSFETLDLSSCPALEGKELSVSRIEINRIMPPSLKPLSTEECNFTGNARPRTSTARPVSLRATICSGWAPFLEDTPVLAVAHVRIKDDIGYDMCDQNHYRDCNLKACCKWKGVENGGSVVFQGLSGATELELTSDPSVVSFLLSLLNPRLLLLLT